MKSWSVGLVHVAAFVCALFAQNAQAGAKEYYIQQRLLMEAQWFQPVDEALAVEQGTYDQKVDQLDSTDQRTFKQRYYVNSAYAEGPDSPVFYMICGEGSCSSNSLSGAIASHARAFKGHMVALEHRYYGKSMPLPTLSTADLKYLTTAQALADLARFQAYVQEKRGFKGKWIAIGGSYAGSLSAFYRMRYPENVAAALSSSGPVFAKANFEDYDKHVSQVAGPQCAAAMRKAVVQIEKSLENPDTSKAMRKKFNAEEVLNDVDFLYVVADMAAFAVQYGMRDDFCNALTQGGDSVENYARVGTQIFSRFGITALEDSFQGAESTDPKAYENGIGMRAWLYQSCTEYGYWQTAHHDPEISVRSARITLPYHDEACKRLFGIEKPVDAVATNAQYYDKLLNPTVSKIYMTNGSNDPWSLLSITHELGNDTNPNLVYETLEGASHCNDLGLGSTGPVKNSQLRFQKLLQGWL